MMARCVLGGKDGQLGEETDRMAMNESIPAGGRFVSSGEARIDVKARHLESRRDSNPFVPEELLKIARHFNACHFPHLLAGE